jgi:hypothetical protein
MITRIRQVSQLRGRGARLPRVPAISSVFVGLCLLAPDARAAYTDPGTGALLWQTLMAAAVGFSFYIRRFVQRLLRRKAGTRDATDGK